MAEVTRAFAAIAFVLLAAGACAQQAPNVKLERIAKLEVDGGVTCAAAFAPDGSAIATASARGDLMLIELPSRKVRWRVAPSDHWVGEVRFAPNGRTIACKGRHLTLHDVANGREIDRWPDCGPQGFAWNADGSAFAFLDQGRLTVIDTKTREPVVVDCKHAVAALAYSGDGSLFVADRDGHVWRIAPGVDEAVSLDHEMSKLAAARGGESFAVGRGEKTVRWWPQRGAEPASLEIGANVCALAIAPDDRTLFVATGDGRQALHRDREAPIEVPGHLAPVYGFAMSPDGSVVAAPGSRAFGGESSWSVMPVQGGAIRRLPGALSVREGRRGSELIVQYEKRLALVDGRTGVQTATFDTETGFCMLDSVVGPGDRVLCATAGDWIDVTTKVRTKVPAPIACLENLLEVATSCDGMWAIGTVDGVEGELGVLLVTDARGRTLHLNRDGPVESVAFSPDGKRLYYARGWGFTGMLAPRRQELRALDTSNFTTLRTAQVSIGPWRMLDDAYALTTSNGQLQVWDATTLQPVRTIATDEPVHGFLLSEDRRTLARSNGREVLVYRVHRGD